jgi:hypothetical protein
LITSELPKDNTVPAEHSTHINAVKTPPPKQPLTNSVNRPTSTPNLEHAPKGFCPFYEHTTVDNINSNIGRSTQNEKVCLLLGSSITKNVDGNMLSRKSRTVISAYIYDLIKIANEFYSENPCIVHRSYFSGIAVNIKSQISSRQTCDPGKFQEFLS